jgi:predicted amidophosphoribosyltransferase
MQIYCPLCEYHPVPADLWACMPGCGTLWHTFDTHGRCPGCQKQWRETNCPACARWSPHEDWYHDETPLKEQEEDVAAEELAGVS